MAMMMQIKTHTIGYHLKAAIPTGEVVKGVVEQVKVEAYRPEGHDVVVKIYYTIDYNGKKYTIREYDVKK